MKGGATNWARTLVVEARVLSEVELDEVVDGDEGSDAGSDELHPLKDGSQYWVRCVEGARYFYVVDE